MADALLINADLAPVGAERRTWGTWNFAALWVAMAITIPTYTLASSLVERGWTWLAAVGSVVLGNLIVLIPIALNSHAGTRYGIPFPVLTRASFGVFGANVPSLLRALVACGWFGIQTWIGGWAIYKLLAAIWPGIAALPTVLPAWLGLGTARPRHRRIPLFHAVLGDQPLGGHARDGIHQVPRDLGGAVPVDGGGSPFHLGLENGVQAGVGAVFGAGLTSAVAFWGTMALSIPDFSRYARRQRDQVLGQAMGLPPTMALFAFIGAAVTSATAVIFGTRIADPIELLSRVGGPITVVIAMLGLAVATLTTNIAANVVAPANGFSNVAPRRVSFKTGVVITAVIGILMLPWRLYNDAAAYIFTWLIGYGALLGPVAGIMIADYFVLRRGILDLDGLYRRGGPYEYSSGVNWIAMAALALGIAPNLPGFLAALGVIEGSPLFTGIYNWAWFVGFVVSGGVYLAGMRAFAGSGYAEP
jgi:NCS1 family nucleobase:cation symporter-1